jgi:hypothetical protein
MYPRSWRDRYGAELEELLETGRGGFQTAANVVWLGLHERVFPTQGPTMDQDFRSAKFRSLCVGAPWAMFSIAPVFLLAGVYFVACLILWSGWTVFLPGADSPFGGHRVHGVANLYFQFGKFFYYSAPILVGWGIELIAVRQKAKVAWPALGLVLIAWMGATARIQASRTAVPGGFGHIHMDFALWPLAQNVLDGLFHAVMILILTVLPYLLWRIQKARPLFS